MTSSMTSMTIGRRFIVTAALSLLLIASLTLVAVRGSRTSSSAISLIAEDALPSVVASMQIESDVNLLYSLYFKHIASITPEDMAHVEQEIDAAGASLEKDLKSYHDKMDPREEDQRNFATLSASLPQFQTSWLEVRPLSRLDKTAEAIALFNKVVNPRYIALQTIDKTIVVYNDQLAEQRAQVAIASAKRSFWEAVSIGTASLILCILISGIMIRQTNRVLRQATEDLTENATQVATAAVQVSAASESLAQASSEQAATLEETSAATSEINAMAKRNTANSTSTAEIVIYTQKSFQETNHLLDQLLTAMDGINHSSQKISKIIKVIDEIAFQTNILALNAAVEAARAGDAGMGFAVVADEVRNLAQRSANAAKDTANLIEESIQNSNGGKTKVERVAQSIHKLTAEVGKMKVLIDEIDTGSNEQARGIGQVTTSIQQMEQVTQNSAANAEKGASAAKELSAQANAMQHVVNRLAELVGVAQDLGSPAPRPAHRLAFSSAV